MKKWKFKKVAKRFPDSRTTAFYREIVKTGRPWDVGNLSDLLEGFEYFSPRPRTPSNLWKLYVSLWRGASSDYYVPPFGTPELLVTIFERLFSSLKNPKSILDPSSNLASLSFVAKDLFQPNRFVAFCRFEEVVDASKKYYENDPHAYFHVDLEAENLSKLEEKFDAVVCAPPFGVRSDVGRSTVRIDDVELRVDYLEKVVFESLMKLEEEGIAIFLLPVASVEAWSKNSKGFWEALEGVGFYRNGIFELPRRIFFPCIKIDSYLVTIKKAQSEQSKEKDVFLARLEEENLDLVAENFWQRSENTDPAFGVWKERSYLVEHANTVRKKLKKYYDIYYGKEFAVTDSTGKTFRKPRPRPLDRRIMDGLIEEYHLQNRVVPLDLECELDKNSSVPIYQLTYQGKVVNTRGTIQYRVEHETPHLIEHIIDEFRISTEIAFNNSCIEEPEFFSSYEIFGLQKLFIENESDVLSRNFDFELIADPILSRDSGVLSDTQLKNYDSVIKWLDSEGFSLPDSSCVDLDQIIGVEDLDISQRDHSDTEAFFALSAHLKSIYRNFSWEEKAATAMLHSSSLGVGIDRALIYSICLISGECTPIQYAIGVTEAHAPIEKFSHGLSAEAYTTALRSEAVKAIDYVENYQKGLVIGRLKEILESDEGSDIEFKSSLRYDIKENSNNRLITQAIMKSIAAFLNSEGGTLVIGVDDAKNIVGIEHDGFENNDKFLLHLTNSITNAIGPHLYDLLDMKFVSHIGKDICVVEVKESPEPVWCKTKKGESKFFVRTGPQSIPLDDVKSAEYIRTHFS